MQRTLYNVLKGGCCHYGGGNALKRKVFIRVPIMHRIAKNGSASI